MRTVCFVSGNARRASGLTIPSRGGYSRFKELLAKDSYEAKTISLLEKPGSFERLHNRHCSGGAHCGLSTTGSRCH